METLLSPTESAQNRNSSSDTKPATSMLRFGTESTAYYDVPTNSADFDVTLGNPNQLHGESHTEFETEILAELQDMLDEVAKQVQSVDPDLAEERYFRPQIRVYQPGTYLNLSTVNGSDRMQKQNMYKAYFSYGSVRHSFELDINTVSIEHTKKALIGLLESIQNDLGEN